MRRHGNTPPSNLNDEKEKVGGGILQTVYDGLARFFGQDRRSIERRERRRQIDIAVNRIFEGTGLVGALIGGIVKRVGYMVTSMMEESANDLRRIQSKTISYLRADSACYSYLGENIQCSSPSQVSSSSSNINGITYRSYLVIMQVYGSRDSGRVRVKAQVDSDGILRILELTFLGANGCLLPVLGNDA